MTSGEELQGRGVDGMDGMDAAQDLQALDLITVMPPN